MGKQCIATKHEKKKQFDVNRLSVSNHDDFVSIEVPGSTTAKKKDIKKGNKKGIMTNMSSSNVSTPSNTYNKNWENAVQRTYS